jgi:bifunctional non-homologous end joining protein LigD
MIVTPMLATLTDVHFSDPNWIYERKLDGERVIATRGTVARSSTARTRRSSQRWKRRLRTTS